MDEIWHKYVLQIILKFSWMLSIKYNPIQWGYDTQNNVSTILQSLLSQLKYFQPKCIGRKNKLSRKWYTRIPKVWTTQNKFSIVLVLNLNPLSNKWSTLIKAWNIYPDCPPPTLWQTKANVGTSVRGIKWSWGQLWMATPLPVAPCRWRCTVHTWECQVFNFLQVAEHVVIIIVHLTDRCKCHMSLVRTWRWDIKCRLKLLRSYIHPAIAIKSNLFISFPSQKLAASLFGTIGCLSIELSHK